MKPELKKLEKLEKERAKEQKRHDLAVSFNLCPECGAKLTEIRMRAYCFPVTVCSENIKHFTDYGSNNDVDVDDN